MMLIDPNSMFSSRISKMQYSSAKSTPPIYSSDTSTASSTATIATNQIPYTMSYPSFNLLSQSSMNNGFCTMTMQPTMCTKYDCEHNKNVCKSVMYLSAECNNVQPTVPHILPPKHLICDPTQSVGVYAPLFPQTFSLPKFLKLPNISPSLSSVKASAVDIPQRAPKPQKPPKPNKNTTDSKKGKRPFKCPQCDKSFRNKSGLSNHKVIHRKIKPHKCKHPGCTKAFARSCDLTRHTRLHTGVKPFKCTFGDCGKAFTRSVQLRLHMMDHTGLRPHKCKICKKGFKTLQNMQIHMVHICCFFYTFLFVCTRMV